MTADFTTDITADITTDIEAVPSECPSLGRVVLTQRDGQFVGTGELLEMPQRKVLEEQRRGSVQQRATESFGASHDVDETALVERLQHAAHVHPADLLDVGAADGLAV